MRNVRNQVQIVGNLGRDVELRSTANDRKWTSLSIAVNGYYLNARGERVETTDWIRVVAWGPLAENMSKILQKGDQVMIQGRLSTRSYEDKNKQTQYITEVVAEQFLFISSPSAVATAWNMRDYTGPEWNDAYSINRSRHGLFDNVSRQMLHWLFLPFIRENRPEILSEKVARNSLRMNQGWCWVHVGFV